jgi:alpha-L-rhamnosidase
LAAAVLALSLALVAGVTKASAAPEPVALRCEYRVNPLGVDEVQPCLTWQVESGQRGQKQTAYQILVASEKTLLEKNQGDLWDSGKVASEQSAWVQYSSSTS